MIQVTEKIAIDEAELGFDFVRASGPGGQNVNKVATAAQLRYNVMSSAALPEDVRERLILLAGKRVTSEGELVITAKRYRTQEKNRRDAVDRLLNLIRKAAEKPKPRIKTQPSARAKQKRLEEKRRRSQLKQQRRADPTSDG